MGKKGKIVINFPTVEFKIANSLLEKLGGLPDYQTAGAAGIDVRACIEDTVEIKPGEVKKIKLGFAIYPAAP